MVYFMFISFTAKSVRGNETLNSADIKNDNNILLNWVFIVVATRHQKALFGGDSVDVMSTLLFAVICF